ncbi:CDP-6-deoxy-delta-3,4-glucoseen reductase [Hydrogenophaga sp.]|uniref:CDP-6-deoxy-delta-3,4-glucoseen reductase n=1 Tax=Hydrogenophaga sp. TaxID=1904254 RepID=UPI003561A760
MQHVITLQPSGRSFGCSGDIPILKAGLDDGVQLPFSCRSGMCRSCRGRLVTGSVDYGPVHPAYLSEADKAAGHVHLCQAKALSDCVIQIQELDPSLAFPVKAMPTRVLAMDRLADDVMRLQLGVPANEPLRFHAGQYVDILTKDGLRRSYSMANAPSTDGVRQIELHIRHMPGGQFGGQVFEHMQQRDLLRIEGPHGQFYLREDSDKPMVLLASGTGFAPIKSLIEHSLTKGLRRPMHLYWGGRTKADLYLHELATAWAQAHEHIRYTPVLSDATPACAWQGRTGFVHRAVLQDVADLSASQVYACGAPIVVESARREFTALRGLPENAFFADAFVSEADKALQAQRSAC